MRLQIERRSVRRERRKNGRRSKERDLRLQALYIRCFNLGSKVALSDQVFNFGCPERLEWR
jgi:hypothetical protein